MSDTKMLRDIELLKPNAKEACKEFLRRCKAEGLEIFLTETLRTASRQKWLFTTQEGSTNCDGVNRLSNHQRGVAWDIACKGGNLYDRKTIDRAGAIGMEMGLVWGGSWGWDSPHFELPRMDYTVPVEKNTPKPTKVILNRELVTVESILYRDQNYIKLRDLETEWLKIDYREGKIYVNDIEFTGDRKTYKDHSYIKLRDLPESVVQVSYDDKLKMPVINRVKA